MVLDSHTLSKILCAFTPSIICVILETSIRSLLRLLLSKAQVLKSQHHLCKCALHSFQLNDTIPMEGDKNSAHCSKCSITNEVYNYSIVA